MLLLHRALLSVGGAAAGGGFSPADFGADLVAWYDAQDSGSLTLSGSSVTQWDDLSGNGEHLVQATGSQQPTYGATSFNTSYPGISFDGGDGLTCSSFAGTSGAALSTFIVGQMNSGTAGFGRALSYRNGTKQDFAWPDGACLIIRDGSSNAINAYRNGAALATKALTTGAPARIGTIFNGANYTAYVDNSASSTSAVTDNFGGSGELSVGGGLESTAGVLSSFWTGFICEVVIVKKALDSTERQDLDDYFTTRWGL
jgi:hypothetical protein